MCVPEELQTEETLVEMAATEMKGATIKLCQRFFQNEFLLISCHPATGLAGSRVMYW